MLVKRSTFSIVVPIHGTRDGKVALRSVLSQNYPEDLIELLVVCDDKAEPYYPEIGGMLKVVTTHPERYERCISRNEGMMAAKNDWIIWLDSDDELVSTALYDLDYCIRHNVHYKIFHWGGIVYWEPKTWDEPGYDPRTSIRPTPNLEEDVVGMKPFKTGLVAAGHFCFQRKLLDEVGGLIHTTSPYEMAEKAKEEFPEFADPENELYLVDTLGNPWGDDYYMMYKLTRKYKSRGLPLNLYIQHVRR